MKASSHGGGSASGGRGGVADEAREWTTFGRYVLLDKVGVGGMAEIYRAKTFGAAGFEKEFAIKLILPALVDDNEFVEMFVNEAKISVSLYHANIVQVFDLGQIEGQYFIAMEFVHGKDLLDVLARCAELEIHVPLHLVLFATMEMLKGLDFAHRAKDPYGEALNIIHRDVSPSNVMISYAGDVKIGDFGVAKAAIQRNLTESGTLKGKVGYMSPEQVMGEAIDARSDIFSAGIVFFEALSMSRLFAGGSDLDVMLRVRDADIREALTKAGPLPEDLREIVLRALSRHREERYQSAGEFYQALVDFCFRHGVKVTESDLSNFMRRLFADRIEQESARRRRDPHASLVTSSAGYVDQSGAHGLSGRAAGSDTLDNSASLAISSSAGVEAAAQQAPRYTYRDAEGAEFGPMTRTALVEMLLTLPPSDAERVARDGDGWQALGEFFELAEVAAERHRPAQASLMRKPARGAESSEASEPGPDLDSTLELGSAPRLLAAQLDADRARPVNKAFERHTGSQLSSQDLVALRDEYGTYEGELERFSFPRILARLRRTRSTGRLQVSRGEIEKSIYFKDGDLILVDSNREDELLGSFLIQRGFITKLQLSDGLSRLNEMGGRLGDALVTTGAIAANEIFSLLSEQMREKLLEVFTWTEGSYGYFENQEPTTHGYPLDVDCMDVVVRGCRERVALERIVALYEERLHIAIQRDRRAAQGIEELKLRSAELRVANQFEDGITLHALLRKFPPSQRSVVYRTVYMLHQTELWHFEVRSEEISFIES